MGPIWGRQDPGGPHVGPVNFAIWSVIHHYTTRFTLEKLSLIPADLLPNSAPIQLRKTGVLSNIRLCW